MLNSKLTAKYPSLECNTTTIKHAQGNKEEIEATEEIQAEISETNLFLESCAMCPENMYLCKCFVRWLHMSVVYCMA